MYERFVLVRFFQMFLQIGIAAYAVGNHRHAPEIEQQLTAVAGKDVSTPRSFDYNYISLLRFAVVLISSNLYIEMNRKIK